MFLKNVLIAIHSLGVTVFFGFIILSMIKKGNFGRKEKNGWRTHGRNGAENINHRGGFHGGGSSRSRSSGFHPGRSQGLHENSIPDSDPGRREDKRERRQFEAEDFVSSLSLERRCGVCRCWGSWGCRGFYQPGPFPVGVTFDKPAFLKALFLILPSPHPSPSSYLLLSLPHPVVLVHLCCFISYRNVNNFS